MKIKGKMYKDAQGTKIRAKEICLTGILIVAGEVRSIHVMQMTTPTIMGVMPDLICPGANRG